MSKECIEILSSIFSIPIQRQAYNIFLMSIVAVFLWQRKSVYFVRHVFGERIVLFISDQLLAFGYFTKNVIQTRNNDYTKHCSEKHSSECRRTVRAISNCTSTMRNY